MKKQIMLYVANPNCKMINPEHGDSDEDFIALMNNSEGLATDYGDAPHYTYFNINDAWYMTEYHYDSAGSDGDCGISYKQLAYLFEILGFDVCITDGFPDWVKNKDTASSMCINISNEHCNPWKDHRIGVATNDMNAETTHWDVLKRLKPLLDKLENKGYECLCSALHGDINIRVEGTKICDNDAIFHLGIEVGHTCNSVVQVDNHMGVISVSNYGDYAIIGTIVYNIDLLEKFIDCMLKVESISQG